MNMGAGRVVYQDLTRIDKSIRDGEFFESPALAAAMDACARRTRMRCTSSASCPTAASTATSGICTRSSRWRRGARCRGSSCTSSPTAATRRRRAASATSAELEDVDAARRRRPRRHGLGPLLRDGSRQALGADEARLRRDRRARRRDTSRRRSPRSTAIQALVRRGRHRRVHQADRHRRRRRHSPIGPMRDGDSVIFFNFRADRARQLTRALALDDFDGFDAARSPARRTTTTMTVYDATFNLPVVFTPQTFSGNLADVLAAHGRTNLRLAETEKYAHVTYFFNCGREEPYPGEDRILVPSPKVATYDLQAGDERAGDHRQPRRRPRRRDGTRSSSAISPTPTWSATRAARRDGRRPSRRSTAAWAASSRPLRAAGGTADRHRRPRQRRADVGRRAEGAAHGAHVATRCRSSSSATRSSAAALKDGSLRDVAPTMLDLLDIPLAPEMTGRTLIEK